MSVAHIYTVAFVGIEAREVDVQVHMVPAGQGMFTVVGLADKAATDKLVWIARNEQNLQLKRRAISALSRNSDPTIRQALQDIVER